MNWQEPSLASLFGIPATCRRVALLATFLTALTPIAPIETAVAQPGGPVKLALIITQSKYHPDALVLRAPPQDGVNMSKALATTLKFSLYGGRIYPDLSAADLNGVVTGFVAEIRKQAASGKKVIAFFYYSGHGASAGVTGVANSFLIPTSFAVPAGGDVASAVLDQGYGLDQVLAALRTAGAQALFVVFDACRTNFSSAAAANRGFGTVVLQKGMDLMFSTEAGTTAPDNNDFSGTLSRELTTGHDVVQIFHDTEVSVSQHTGSTPLFYDGLPYANFTLSGPAPVLVAVNAPRALAAANSKGLEEAAIAPAADDAVRRFFTDYVTAWRIGDIPTQDRDLASDFTSTTFKAGKPQVLNRASFLQEKRVLAKRYKQGPNSETVRISIANLRVSSDKAGIKLQFDQYFDSPYYLSSGKATWWLRDTAGRLQISKIVYGAETSVRRVPSPGMQLPRTEAR